jgi:spore coat polysaccharide biosynthesis protein SpsF
VVRITADCPLLDPTVVDRVVLDYLDNDCDYASNTIERTYPDGLDTEVFSFAALERAWHQAKLLSEREHVTPYIWKHPDLFKLRQVTQPQDLSALRWTVDEPEDMEFARRVYDALYKPGRVFHMPEILRLLQQHPELQALNAGFELNEGYNKSVAQDRAAL